MVVRSNRFKRWKAKIEYFDYLTLDNKSALLLSLFLTALLLFAEFFFSRQTNSLLLFCTGLVQLSLSVFILFLLYTHYRREASPNLQLRLAASLLNGFFLLLLTGYIFLEIYVRAMFPAEVIGRQALAVMLISLVGNVIIQRLLLMNNILPWKFNSFHLTIPGINAFFLFALFAVALIYLTNLDIIDSIMGLLMGLTLFTWAGFTMMDAYWKILEMKTP